MDFCSNVFALVLLLLGGEMIGESCEEGICVWCVCVVCLYVENMCLWYMLYMDMHMVYECIHICVDFSIQFMLIFEGMNQIPDIRLRKPYRPRVLHMTGHLIGST